MSRWNNQLKTIALLGALSAVLVGLGAMIAPAQLWLFGLMAVAMNFGAYFFSDRLVLQLHGAREVTASEAPHLHRTVAELATRAGVPMPRVCLVDDPQPNAFATGRSPRHGVVAVTTGLLALLEPREMRAVIAHELAHIKNRDTLVCTLAAAAAGVVSWAANALSFGALFGGGAQQSEEEQGSAAGGLLVALAAPVAATIVQLAISRTREFLADQTGAMIAEDPLALASALRRLEAGVAVQPGAPSPATASLYIVNPLSGSGLGRWFSTHPSTDERVARLVELARGARLAA
jgi:heat shock protein HtpX